MPEMYEDEECTYCWGDPRFNETIVRGKIIICENEIRFQGDKDTVIWPAASVLSIQYEPTHPVDLDEIAREKGIDAAHDIAIGLGDLQPEPALSIRVKDPEGIETDGFEIRVVFRNERYARAFAKRAATIARRSK